MTAFQFEARTRVSFDAGALKELGSLAAANGFRRTLLVADRGMVTIGYMAQAARNLKAAGIEVFPFHDFNENPNSDHVEAGRAHGARHQVDSLVGLGGGSSLDCAKGINFVLSNGGRVQDYWGYGKAQRPLLPMIGVPTTTGTGSEAQSYALISDAETHVKMACGAPGAAFRHVLLDPCLALSQPRRVLAATGYDAISHAVESFVTTKRNYLSDCFAREAWRLLEANYERMLADSGDLEAAAGMQVGAFLAGAAIEHSMLGAAHACANPLTARHGITHGVAIALVLVHVVRWNGDPRYRELDADLAGRLERMAEAAGLPRKLRAFDISKSELTVLAEDASKQWTGQFNPREFDREAAKEIYRCAF